MDIGFLPRRLGRELEWFDLYILPRKSWAAIPHAPA